jgi:mannan endo-1,6-alpha-mannosidase
MSAMGVFQSLLIQSSKMILSNFTGGTSAGDPSAGTGQNTDPFRITPPTAGDRAGAGFVTAVIIVMLLGGVGFMVTGS